MIQVTQPNRILFIRKVLMQELLEVHDRVYYEQAPDSPTYPYLVFTVNESFDDLGTEVFDVEVDGWGNNPVTTELEQLMSDADYKLHRFTYGENGLFFSCYRDNRRTIQDDNKQLRRRQLVYEIRMLGDGI